jgi:hypothetical protein
VNAHAAACVVALMAVAASGCAPHRLELPSGDGQPFPSFADAVREATASCRDVRTITAELGIAGRAGGHRVRGRATAGLALPAGVRLEGTAPFGPPVFILASLGSQATLLLPRDNRVAHADTPAAILEALVGLDLEAADLLALLSGCVVPDPQPASGELLPAGWARIELAGGTTMFLRRDGRKRWEVRAGIRPGLRAEYERDATGAATAVRLIMGDDTPTATNLRLSLSQVDRNVPLGPEVFAVKVPGDARPITLAELRQVGPMGER